MLGFYHCGRVAKAGGTAVSYMVGQNTKNKNDGMFRCFRGWGTCVDSDGDSHGDLDFNQDGDLVAMQDVESHGDLDDDSCILTVQG